MLVIAVKSSLYIFLRIIELESNNVKIGAVV